MFIVVKKCKVVVGWVQVESRNQANAQAVAAALSLYDPNQDPPTAMQLPDPDDPAMAVKVSFFGS